MENNEHDQPIEASASEQPQQPDKNVFTIKLSLFEGPLDLLLYLIKQNEIDIYDIPIVLITEQFIEYIDIMKALAIDVATEFIVMAAYLIHFPWKREPVIHDYDRRIIAPSLFLIMIVQVLSLPDLYLMIIYIILSEV